MYDFKIECLLKEFASKHSCNTCKTALAGFRCIYRDNDDEHLCKIVQEEYKEANC